MRETLDLNLARARSFHRPVNIRRFPEPPDLGEKPLNLFTLPYVQLLEAITDRLFPPNTLQGPSGTGYILHASEARIDRYILFRAAWSPPFGATLQLALRDLAATCQVRHGTHFTNPAGADQVALLTALAKGSFTAAEWTVERSQQEAFTTFHDAVCADLLAEPGYGGNHNGLGWY
jgi:hypothetical protein